MSITLPTKTHIKKLAKGSVTYASTFATDLGEYAINVGRKGTDGIRTDMLYPAIRQMEAMLSYHNKVYQIRLESHSPKYEANNNEFVSMLARLKDWLHGKGHKRVAYLWVREKDTSKQYHYHAVLWLDGNLIRSPYSVLQRWGELHKERGHSHDEWVDSTPMIHRGNAKSQSKAVYIFSYLCKERCKGYGERYSRDFSTSLLKPK